MATIETRSEFTPRRDMEVSFRVVLPDGNGRVVWADEPPKVGDKLSGHFNGWTVTERFIPSNRDELYVMVG
jgi:hypothetical protein